MRLPEGNRSAMTLSGGRLLAYGNSDNSSFSKRKTETIGHPEVTAVKAMRGDATIFARTPISPITPTSLVGNLKQYGKLGEARAGRCAGANYFVQDVQKVQLALGLNLKQ